MKGGSGRSGGRPGRGRGGRRGGREAKPHKTVDELDAEMSSYMKAVY